MTPDLSLREVQLVALAADMIIATCEEDKATLGGEDLGARVLAADPYSLIGALCAVASVLLDGSDHRTILAEMVEFLAGRVE